MLYNKNRFQKYNDKKVLHKVKKQWVTISLALFMMIGGGAVTAHIGASADTNKGANESINELNKVNQPNANNDKKNTSVSTDNGKPSVPSKNPSNGVTPNKSDVSNNNHSDNNSNGKNSKNGSNTPNENPNENKINNNGTYFSDTITLNDNQAGDNPYYEYSIHGNVNKPFFIPWGNGQRELEVDSSGNLIDPNEKDSSGKYKVLSKNFTNTVTPKQLIRQTTITALLKFYYDDGDGKPLTPDTDYSDLSNISNNKYHGPDGPGLVTDAVTVSGYKGERYSLPIGDVDGKKDVNGKTVDLYPDFNLHSNRLTVVLGEGYGNNGTDTNDNGNYWLGSDNDNGSSQRIVNMVARRYWTHIYYEYNGKNYDGGVVYGLNGHSVSINDNFSNAQKKDHINPNLMLQGNPSYQFSNQSGNRNQPNNVYFQLTPKSNITETFPIMLEDNEQLGSGNKYSGTPTKAYVTVHNTAYGNKSSYLITKSSISTNGSTPNPLDSLNDKSKTANYLVSEGTLSEIADVNNAGNTFKKWYLNNPNINDQGQQINNINLPGTSQVGAYNLNGQIVPIIYYRPFQPSNGANNLITVPYVSYNYKFWTPKDRSQQGIQNYNNKFVHNSQGISRNDEGDYADNFWTNYNWNVADGYTGDYMPSGSILQMNPWSDAPNFNIEDSKQPDNDWYIQLNKNSQGKAYITMLRAVQGNGGQIQATNGDTVNYLGIANGSNQYGATQKVSNDASNDGQTGFTVTYGNQSQWYPRNSSILWDTKANKFCVYNSGDNGQGYYTVNGQKINFQPNEKQNNIVKRNGGFNVGDMNAYAKPMPYSVKFANDGNYYGDNNQVNYVNQFRSPNLGCGYNGQYTSYSPVAKSDENNNTFSNNTNDYRSMAYTGDQITYNTKDGTFYLKPSYLEPNNSQPNNDIPNGSIGLLSIPTYDVNDKNLHSNLVNQLKYSHRLVHDSQYEKDYLDDLERKESQDSNGYNINNFNESNPSLTWVIGSNNQQSNIWPDNNNTAVVYTASSQIKALNSVSFVDLDTGYQFSNDSSVYSLFNNIKDNDGDSNSQFDMADFINKLEDEQGSRLLNDGTWNLRTKFLNGTDADVYVVRTDSPNRITNNNNTFIYISAVDLNSPSNNGIPRNVKVQYLDTDGDPIDGGTHDVMTHGGLRAVTVKQALSNGHENLWDYYDNGNGYYEEVGLIPGEFATGNYDKSTPDKDANNQYMNDKSIYGMIPCISIVLKPNVKQGQSLYGLDFIDKDNPNNSAVSKNDIQSRPGNTGSATGYTGTALSNSLNSLSNAHYNLAGYTINGQSQTNKISSLESNPSNFQYHGQNIDIYLTHATEPASSAVNQNSEHISYSVEGNGVKAPASYSNSVTFKRGQEKDLVTNSLVPTSPWSQAGSFSNVNSPSVSGYYPNYQSIAAPQSDANKALNYNYMVIYSPDSVPTPQPPKKPNHKPNKPVPNKPNKPNKPNRPNRPNRPNNVPNRPNRPNNNRPNKPNKPNQPTPKVPNNVPTPVTPNNPANTPSHHNSDNKNNHNSNQGLKSNNDHLNVIDSHKANNRPANHRRKTVNHKRPRVSHRPNVSRHTKSVRRTKSTRRKRLPRKKMVERSNRRSSHDSVKSKNTDISRRATRKYVNGIDDARRGLNMKSHYPEYVKGYQTFKHANGGELPQTGENNHITLAVAVLMVFSFVLDLPMLLRKKR